MNGLDMEVLVCSIMALAKLEPTFSWLDTLQFTYPDTTFVSDSTIYHSAYQKEIYQDEFLPSKEQTIQLCETFLELFPEPIDSSLFFPDTTMIMSDSLVMSFDSISILIDSVILPMDSTFSDPDTTSQNIPEKDEDVEP